MSETRFQLSWFFLVGMISSLVLFAFTVDRRDRKPSYLTGAEEITCQPGLSAELIADAWQALANDNISRALACSQIVITEYSEEANAQQRQLGSEIPENPEAYSALNDVGTAWFIQGEALYTKKATLSPSERLYALAAFRSALKGYPSAYALYADGGYWPVRQAAFCRLYQFAPDQVVQLPAVYTDQYDSLNCYLPSGYMPNKEQYDTVVDPDWTENPHSGETSIRVVYSAVSGGWEGVYMQYPENNWGEEAGLDLGQVSALTFWARGEHSGEVVEFKVGGILGSPYSDTLDVSLGTIELKSEWQLYTIDLSRRDTSNIIGAFAWIIIAQNNPNGATFFLDDILFVE